MLRYYIIIGMVRNVSLLNELDVFKKTAYVKLFTQFKKKYFSLGSMRGSVVLKTFHADEIEEIAGFLGVSAIQLARKGKVTLRQFEEQLATSAFAHYTLQQLVENILQEKLQTKAELAATKATATANFSSELARLLKDIPRWHQQIIKRQSDSLFIWRQQNEVLTIIAQIAPAIMAHLQRNKFERLPLFAQQATGNPHAFDVKELAGKLLVHAAFSIGEQAIAYPKTTAERVDVLATLQIIQDDLWNFVTIQGLIGYEKENCHPVWQAAIATNSALNMPMRQLLTITKVIPACGNKVYIVENSSVASTLMDANPTAAIICTHGQLRMASWRLLDVVDTNTEIYYSGDLDPEGILIAQNIVNRYGKRVVLWCMDETCYKMGMAKEILTEQRLKQLQSATIIPTVVEQIQRYKKASYQEAWVALLIKDLQ